MDRHEKNQIRDYIGQYLNVSGTRLTDDEARFLMYFIDHYDERYRGRSATRTPSHTGWSSDGKYRRTEVFIDTFIDDIGILQEYSYHDDDGHTGGSRPTVIQDARGILNWFRDYGHLLG